MLRGVRIPRNHNGETNLTLEFPTGTVLLLFVRPKAISYSVVSECITVHFRRHRRHNAIIDFAGVEYNSYC